MRHVYYKGLVCHDREVIRDVTKRAPSGHNVVVVRCNHCKAEQKITIKTFRDAGCRCQAGRSKGPGDSWKIFKHGRTKTPEYRAWADMRYKCYNPRRRGYETIGALGIKVCEQWADFQTFINDMGPRPEGFRLIRKDRSRDFTPENTVWSDIDPRAQYVEDESNVAIYTPGKQPILQPKRPSLVKYALN